MWGLCCARLTLPISVMKSRLRPTAPEPNPVGGTTFCSQTDYFELITDLQADVIEVTGNHVNDWGSENLEYTLDLYEENGMTYFGGGRNAEDATRPALLSTMAIKLPWLAAIRLAQTMPGPRRSAPVPRV